MKRAGMFPPKLYSWVQSSEVKTSQTLQVEKGNEMLRSCYISMNIPAIIPLTFTGGM
jgi:hypothetical protein